MSDWVNIPLDFEPRPAGKSDVFVRSSQPFTADLGKVSAAMDRERQRHFENQLERIAWHLGTDTVPVFLSFDGDRRRMDKGCVGHAVASGFLEAPTNGDLGYVTHVRLHRQQEAASTGGAEIWKAYRREAIPGLFGHEFSTGAWNQGFIVQGRNAFLLVTLDKSGHHSDHRYSDVFVDRQRFRWQSQNRTTQASNHGQIISQSVPGYAIHLFVRPRKLVDGSGAPFIYCGALDFVTWTGEQPITVEWALRSPLPDNIAGMFGLADA